MQEYHSSLLDAHASGNKTRVLCGYPLRTPRTLRLAYPVLSQKTASAVFLKLSESISFGVSQSLAVYGPAVILRRAHRQALAPLRRQALTSARANACLWTKPCKERRRSTILRCWKPAQAVIKTRALCGYPLRTPRTLRLAYPVLFQKIAAAVFLKGIDFISFLSREAR